MMKLAKTRYLCDVILYNGPQAQTGIAMHSLILRAESDLWNYEVEKRAERKRADEQIEIRLNSPQNNECFKAILRYMYSGKIEVNIANVHDMQRCATALQVPEVMSLCGDFLQLLFSGQNLVTLMSALKMMPGGDESELMAMAREQITRKMDHAAAGKNDGFNVQAVLNAGIEELKTLVNDYSMTREQNELEKLAVLLNWLNYNREKRLKYLHQLLDLIDFRKMTEAQLVSCWEIDDLFKTDAYATELLMKANLTHALDAAARNGELRESVHVDVEPEGHHHADYFALQAKRNEQAKKRQQQLTEKKK